VDRLPDWEPGTPGVLCVAGPHAIPVSTGVRAGDRRLLFALGSKRDALARLRSDPSVAYCLLGEGVAFTAVGEARVVAERLEAAPVVAVELRVSALQDHLMEGRTELLDGARWRFTSERDSEADTAIVAELQALASA
jgi:hypothetical protein